jgi:hypothetical protein
MGCAAGFRGDGVSTAPATAQNPPPVPYNPAPVAINGVIQPSGPAPETAASVAALVQKEIG